MGNNNEITNLPCTVFQTKWFSIEAVPFETRCSEPYYRLSCNNSVSIIARTVEGKFILVRQYRPAIEGYILELPSGYIDENETPEYAIKRELQEETGFVCGSVLYLGSLKICPSRINNDLHVFFGKDAKLESIQGCEAQEVEVLLVSQSELRKLIMENQYKETAGIAMYLLAQMKGCF